MKFESPLPIILFDAAKSFAAMHEGLTVHENNGNWLNTTMLLHDSLHYFTGLQPTDGDEEDVLSIQDFFASAWVEDLEEDALNNALYPSLAKRVMNIPKDVQLLYLEWWHAYKEFENSK